MQVRILLVDDNRDTLRTYVKALRRKIKVNGHVFNIGKKGRNEILKLDEADTVPMALKKMEENTYELVVVDIKIPGSDGEEMGGLELISKSLQIDPLRPIIAITGYGSVALAKKTLTQGVFDFIEKSDKAVEDLIQSVQKAIDVGNEKIVRSGNPFTPMTGIDPSIFGGRKKELEFFEEKLNRALYGRYCEHFLALGNWGIGKSTLLREFKKICQSRGHLVSLVPLESFQAGTSLSEVARSIIEGILRDLPYPVERFKKLASYFESIGFSILGTGLQISRNMTSKQFTPQAFLYDSFLNLWKDLKDKSDIVIILLDDLENLMPVSEIVMTLKQTLSMDSLKGTKILVGITSTPSAWVELTSAKIHHPLSRYFLSRLYLQPLSEEEVRETILKSLMGTGVIFENKIIDLVYKYSRGHPFEMQMLCYHLFDNQLSRRVNIEVWEKALQTALSDLGVAIFDNWIYLANEEESKVMQIMAMQSDTGIVSLQNIQKIAANYKTEITKKSLPKYLQSLLEKGLIEKCGRGEYRITDLMFRVYLNNRPK